MITEINETNGANQSSSGGLIIRQREPKVLETPLDRVDSFLTPAELFYVRSHSPAPKLELASYRLQIAGAVRRPFSLTCQELRDMPAETRVALLECAGNSRVFLVPQVQGAQWELRRSRDCRMDRGASVCFARTRRFG
jgi:Oxidoreductase molybdopterin binding domain